MNEEKKPASSFDRGCLGACVMFGCVAVLNIVFLFFAPAELSMPFTGSRVSSLFLAIAGMAVVGLAGVMSVFTPHRKYWFIFETVLTLADVALITSFFVVM